MFGSSRRGGISEDRKDRWVFGGRAGSGACSRWTNRVLLLGMVILAAVALAAGLTACGGDDTTSTTAGDSDELSVVVYGCEYQANETGNPNNDMWAVYTDVNVYETLVRYDDATKTAIPWLATSWDVSEDGLTWTFHLRDGVKFQDGTPFNAAAAKSSIETAMTLNMGWQYFAVTSVEAPDDLTLVLTLSTPYPIDLLLGASVGAYMVSPTAVQKYGEKAYEPGNGAGTGPYVLKAWNTTTESTLERNPDYWGGWEGSHANAPDVAIVRQITEPAVRVQNLEQGVVQVISSAPYTDLDRLQKSGDFKVWSKPSFYYLSVKMNTKKEALSDLNLRAALYYAFPFDDVCQLVYGGYAKPSYGFVMEPAYGYDQAVKEIPAQKQDIAKAKEFLAKSKYPDGNVTFECRVDNASAEAVKAMELYKTALAELNITLDVQSLEMSVIGEAASSENPPQDMCVWSMASGLPISNSALETDLASTSFLNFTYWTDPQIDQLVLDAWTAAATDRQKEPELVIQASKIALDNYVQINCADLDFTPVASTKLKGFEGFNAGASYCVYFYDVWMEE